MTAKTAKGASGVHYQPESSRVLLGRLDNGIMQCLAAQRHDSGGKHRSNDCLVAAINLGTPLPLPASTSCPTRIVLNSVLELACEKDHAGLRPQGHSLSLISWPARRKSVMTTRQRCQQPFLPK